MNELEIFASASDISDPEERARYLNEACGDDQNLRQRIEDLLRQSQRDDSFMEPRDASQTGITIDSLSAITVGQTIGPYKLREKIGEGGMGLVYVAEQKKPVQRRVALKIIKPGMDSRQVIARFEAERQALAMMDHPNIAKVLDAGTTETGLPYFVMELVNGFSITEYCDEQHLTVRERLELFTSVCRAIQHAHQKGVIHRDLKPTNILIALYDGQPVPKVIDFGIAKAVGRTLGDHSIYTQMGQIVGTLEYMSPEQAQRNQLDIDTRSDIFSLGIVLYELLTGSTPFDKQRLRDAALDELFNIIRHEEPPKPSTKVSTSQELPTVAANRRTEPAKLSALVRGELDWIVMKAIEKDRGRRYDTANGLAEDIRRYLEDERVQACPPSPRYQLQKFYRRNRVAISFASVVAILLVTGTAISAYLAIVAKQSEKDARNYLVQVKAQEQLTQKANQELGKSIEQIRAEKEKTDKARIRAEKSNRFIRRIILSPAAKGVNATVSDLLFDLNAKLDEEFADDPETRAELLYTICQANGLLGDPRLNSCAKRCIEATIEAHGADSEYAFFRSGQLYKLLGHEDAEKNETYLIDLVNRAEAQLGENHAVAMHCNKKLARFYTPPVKYAARSTPSKTNVSKAIGVFEKLHRLTQGSLNQGSIGEWDEEDTNEVRLNLAFLYQKDGRRLEAIELLEQEIVWIKQSDRLNTKVATSTYATLADIYMKEGQAEKAIELLASTIDRLKNQYPNQPRYWASEELSLAQTCFNAGLVLKAIDRATKIYELDVVQQMLEKAKNSEGKAFESNVDPDWVTKMVVAFLSKCKFDLWQRTGGDELIDQAVEIHGRSTLVITAFRGTEGKQFKTHLGSLGSYFYFAGRFAEASTVLPTAIEFDQKNSRLPVAYRCSYRLGHCMIELGKYDEAIQILETCIDWENKLKGEVKIYEMNGRDQYGKLVRHLLAYAMYKKGQDHKDLDPWIIEGAQFYYEHLTSPRDDDEISQFVFQRFHRFRKVATTCCFRLLEYLKEHGDKKMIVKWQSRLNELQRMPNPHQKPSKPSQESN